MAQYAVLLGNSNQLVVLTATSDPIVDGNWSTPDGAVTVADPIISLWAVLDGTDIHIATAEDVSGGGGRWAYHKFNTLTDAWTIKDEEITTNSTDHNRGDAISIGVRSDGDVIVLYNANLSTENKVVYARRESGSWTVDIIVSDTPLDDWSGGVIVMEPVSDRAHFFFKNDSEGDAFQRTLTAANVLETFPAAGDSNVSTPNHIFGPGVSYDDGGTKRVRCPYVNLPSGTLVAYAEFDSVDAPGAFTPNTAITEFNVRPLNETLIMSMSVDGLDEYLLFANGESIPVGQLFQDKNKTTDTIVGAVVERVSSNVYDRSGTKLAFLWLDVVFGAQYDELALGAAPATRVPRPVVVRQAVQRASVF